jgi:hypothetical protein
MRRPPCKPARTCITDSQSERIYTAKPALVTACISTSINRPPLLKGRFFLAQTRSLKAVSLYSVWPRLNQASPPSVRSSCKGGGGGDIRNKVIEYNIFRPILTSLCLVIHLTKLTLAAIEGWKVRPNIFFNAYYMSTGVLQDYGYQMKVLYHIISEPCFPVKRVPRRDQSRCWTSPLLHNYYYYGTDQ